jgi:hypothetical protein
LGSCAVGASIRSDLQGGLPVSDRERPVLTRANGTLMARRTQPRFSCSEEDGTRSLEVRSCSLPGELGGDESWPLARDRVAEMALRCIVNYLALLSASC